MTPERGGDHFSSLNSEPDSIILNRRDGCLGDTGQPCQLILAVPLQLSDDSHRLSDRHVNSLLGTPEIPHLTAPDTRAG